jgi:D-glycero-D-manno-heptose 1,7-bisphosphate phosphatase
MRAIFLDRDGTIISGIPKYERIDSIDKVEILPKVLEGLSIFSKMDSIVFLVTNQAGIAEGLITMDEFWGINNKVLEQIAPSGVNIGETYVCPHGTDGTCECRKPKPKMLLDAAEKYDIDLANSYMVGDRPSDVEAGINAGTKTILVRSGATEYDERATYVAKDLLDVAQFIADH